MVTCCVVLVVGAHSCLFHDDAVQLSMIMLLGALVALYIIGDEVLRSHVVEANLVSDAGATRKASQAVVERTRQLELIRLGLGWCTFPSTWTFPPCSHLSNLSTRL